jgi:Glutathione peroxidase
MASFTDFTADSLSGEPIAMRRFAGEVVLVVNTASQCGFTPQYSGLESLYRQYQERGFAVLGFPCNQFGAQEPGNAAEIANFCDVNFGVTFPLFAKVDVNGAKAHPLFQYLKKELPGWTGTAIRWNFTKFLIGRDGKPIRRFAPTTTPQQLAPYIEKALL